MNIDYTFKDHKLLELALTQSGINASNNNERLEFIGDRVLGLSVAALLYNMYPEANEGGLAKRHAILVSTETLAQVAKKLNIAKNLRHGHMTCDKTDHILANAMEAILGAIFLDSDFDTVKNFIWKIWENLAKAEYQIPKDPKTELQEIVQKASKCSLPIYEYTDPIGSPHNPTFTVKVIALGKSAIGTGSSKKEASVCAAENLLKLLAI